MCAVLCLNALCPFYSDSDFVVALVHVKHYFLILHRRLFSMNAIVISVLDIALQLSFLVELSFWSY